MYVCTFTARSAGLPLLNAYKNTGADFKHGVDFAVAGSTALPVDTLADQNILSPVTTSSLGVQLDWMSTHFNSTCDGGRGSSPLIFFFSFFSKRWKMYAWKRSFDVEICECWLISSNDSNFICSCLTDCAEKLKDSLFMVGEIGGNDYNYALFQGKSIEEVKSLVPSVVQAIANAVRVSSHWSIELCFRYFLLSRSK